MSDRSSHWDSVYATKGEAEVSWFQNSPSTSLAMIRAANPDREAAIIDIGGGASRLVDALLQDGYRDVSVLDLSANALDAARTRIGTAASRVDWIVADATTWRPAKTYEVWHDRAAFHFLTDPRDRTAYVERLRSAVVFGGHVIIATFAPEGPEKCSGLPVQRHDSTSLLAEPRAGLRADRDVPRDASDPVELDAGVSVQPVSEAALGSRRHGAHASLRRQLHRMGKVPIELSRLGVERAGLELALIDADHRGDLGEIAGGEDLVGGQEVGIAQRLLDHIDAVAAQRG